MDDEYGVGGIHCWEKACKDAEFVTTVNARAKETRERLAAKRVGAMTGVPMYLRLFLDRTLATSDADKKYLENLDKETAGFSKVVTMLREQAVAAGNIVKAGGELLEATKEFRAGDAAAGKLDSKQDYKKGWKLCADASDCPFKAFGEKVLGEGLDTLRYNDVAMTIKLGVKEMDDKVLAIADPWDRAGAEFDWSGVASRKALLLTKLASFGADLADAVPKMKTVLGRLQTLKTNKDREKETSADLTIKRVSAEETAAKVYGLAKAMCDALNKVLYGACSTTATTDAAQWGQRLGQWINWARLRRPDVNQVLLATDDADPPALAEKADKKKGPEVLALFTAFTDKLDTKTAPSVADTKASLAKTGEAAEKEARPPKDMTAGGKVSSSTLNAVAEKLKQG